jgi:tRNA threonylcarbamoyladenosine biosynthesis protein TsaE
MDTITSNSPGETLAAGRLLADEMRGGEVLVLCGDLGAGKTHFTKGLVEGLGGSAGEVSSPTFTLVHEYRGGRLSVFHFDFYRLGSAVELREIGFDDYLDEKGVMVLEWGERFANFLPSRPWWVRFQIGDGDCRILEIER